MPGVGRESLGGFRVGNSNNLQLGMRGESDYLLLRIPKPIFRDFSISNAWRDRGRVSLAGLGHQSDNERLTGKGSRDANGTRSKVVPFLIRNWQCWQGA